jgi:hypothetical protein
MKQPRTRTKHLCPYCGIRPGITNDHIVPRCLFPAIIPNGVYLPTVKACKHCNGIKKSGDDAFLRDYLACSPELYFYKPAQSLIGAAKDRSFERNRSLFKRSMKNWRQMNIQTPAGLVVPAKVGEPDMMKLHLALAKIVRGLYFKIRDTLLPVDTFFVSGQLTPEQLTTYLGIKEMYWKCPPTHWETFQFWAAFGPESTESFFLMVFYHKIGFYVRSFMPGSDPFGQIQFDPVTKQKINTPPATS